MPTNAGLGALFCASEPYVLQCLGKVRSYYLELPRKEFAARFAKDRIPISTTMSTGRGLGRIATEFCATLASEGSTLDVSTRARLGDELMDVYLAFALGSRMSRAPTRSCSAHAFARSRPGLNTTLAIPSDAGSDRQS